MGGGGGGGGGGGIGGGGVGTDETSVELTISSRWNHHAGRASGCCSVGGTVCTRFTLAVLVSSVWVYRQRLVAGISWQSSVPVHSAALHSEQLCLRTTWRRKISNAQHN